MSSDKNSNLFGFLNVYKPKGMTSFDVVAVLRRITKIKQIGHTGTLDPFAVGVLPICIGKSTRLIEYLNDDKEYLATVQFGQDTDTYDLEGKVTKSYGKKITKDEVIEVLKSFEGEIEQFPPIYSAIKVNGKKLYELARNGIEIERKPRRVEISHIEILECSLPKIHFRVSCSKGTYIRALCADIGDKLGCGAAMKSLIRTRVGTFVIEEAWKLSEVEKMVAEGKLLEHVIAPDRVFMEYPKVKVKSVFEKALANGNILGLNQVTFEKENTLQEGELIRVYNSGDIFTGVYTYMAEEKGLKPYKMFF